MSVKAIAARRDDQALSWMWKEVNESVVEALLRDSQVAGLCCKE